MKYTIFFLSIYFNLGFILAQKQAVVLTVEPSEVTKGSLVNIMVRTTIEGEISITYPKGFTTINGSSTGFEQVIDYNSGDVSTVYTKLQQGTFTNNGSYTIQAFVKHKKQTYKSNKVTVNVGNTVAKPQEEISKKNLKDPLFGIIKKSKNTIYEGEALILESKVYSRYELDRINRYMGFEVKNLSDEAKDISSKNVTPQEENYKGHTFLTFTYGKQVLFPSSIGKNTIEPFKMWLEVDQGYFFTQEVELTSNTSSFEVLPLPKNAPFSFSGGVGSFELETSCQSKKAKIGDVLEFQVKISGQGNLQAISKPKISFPSGLELYGNVGVKDEIEYTEKGASGFKTYTYYLRVKSAQLKEIPQVSFAYFNPDLKKYVQLKSKSIPIQIEGSTAELEQPTLTQAQTPTTTEQNNIQFFDKAESDSKQHSTWITGGVLLLVAGTTLIFWKKQKKVEPVLCKTVSKNLDQNKVQDLLNQLDEAKTQVVSNPNQAIQLTEKTLKSIGEIYGERYKELSKGELIELLEEQNFDVTVTNQLNKLFVSCEEIRYSFEPNSNSLTALIEDSQSFITTHFKKGTRFC